MAKMHIGQRLNYSLLILYIISNVFICRVCAGSREEEEEIFRRYKPLGSTKESIKLLKRPSSLPMTDSMPDVESDNLEPPIYNQPAKTLEALDPLSNLDEDVDRAYYQSDRQKTDYYADTKPEPVSVRKLGLEPVNTETAKKNVSETLYALPKKGSVALTRLMTGKDQATFVTAAVKPTINNNNNKTSKVLASYRILVPIWIPAIKPEAKVEEAPRPKVRMVKEQKTEWIPVQKNKSRVKTIIKAEPVPQQVITDYVKVDRNTVPTGDDKIMDNEQVIKSVVSNYD